MAIKADGFIGAVMAIEGISDATVLLHGQTGCRKGLILSERYNPRVDRIHSTDNPVYMGFTTVPYSGVNAGDYTGRSRAKLEKALRYIACEDYSLVAVVCSPGISIVGDDCPNAVRACGLESRAMVFDNSGYGPNAWDGFDDAMCSVLKRFGAEERVPVAGTVVVTGLSIMHKDWYAVKKEFTGFLELIGLEAVCFTGADCTLQELRDSVNAEYLLDLAPCFSESTREFYRELGIKEIRIGCSPVGFDTVEGLWKEIARVTGRDVSVILEKIADSRCHAYSCIIASRRSLRGRTFGIIGDPSVEEPLERFLIDSFAMVRDDREPDYLFADGNRCRMEPSSSNVRCIDIGFPSNKVDFSRNPVLGLDGTLYLLDRMFE